ncbi:PEP-CTERM sorting domain-containing protein [Marinobacter sp. TBZ242]|uniref:PEP-CTERM sorting domain-containing protein n=1 Tax=Marinobacter azerbaijanicus TaxID=3050455 RepID=A0ABT7IE57_9GAMM|nr:PEP-CTERM sorting domain-containing protein [Marinobacter sp. TBZ242]MDL0432452.1 PEP-CTERM sorting domain-containing protein [Marinobacter sp. TBZ242]
MNLQKLLISFGSAVALTLSGSAFGYYIDGGATNVGDLDTYVNDTGVLGSPEDEATWASSVLGFTVTYSYKSDPASFKSTDEDVNVIAVELLTSPGYFLVKDSTTSVLFKNVASLDWAVFSLEDYFGTKKLEEMELSHLTELDGGTVTVPEPGTLGLVGLGLVGLGLFRRRKSA